MVVRLRGWPSGMVSCRKPHVLGDLSRISSSITNIHILFTNAYIYVCVCMQIDICVHHYHHPCWLGYVCVHLKSGLRG